MVRWRKIVSTVMRISRGTTTTKEVNNTVEGKPDSSSGDFQDVSYFPYSLEIIEQVLFSVKNEKCVEHTKLALEAMTKHERWALEMFDSFAKFPTGILYGNYYELGNFDECVGALGTIKDEENDTETTIQGQYCLTDIHFRAKNKATVTDRMLRSVRNKDRYAYNRTVIHWGICLPSSCTSEDAKIFTKEIFAATAEHFEIVNVTIDDNKCYYEKPQPLSKAEIVYGCIVGVFIIFILLATGYHLWYLKQRKNCTAYNVDNLRAKPPSVPKEVIMCFSLIRNIGKFLHTKPNEMNLECICGIKFISMTLIITGHSLIFMLGGPVANKQFFRDLSTKAENSPFLNNALLVDTFLLVSGFLLSRLLLMELDKRRGKINFAILYIARYIRLTPAYVVVIGLYATILPRLGSGPFWESRIGLEQERCLSSWWTNLLYINNYVNTDKLCMFQAWYLAVDYHLFIVAPFLIYALWKWSKIGEGAIFACTLVSIIVPIYVTYSQGLDPTLMAYPPEIEDLSTNYYFVTAYIKTHMRCSSYGLGVLFGYIVHKIQAKGYKIRPCVIMLGWIMSALLGVMAMYSIVVFYKPEHETSSIEAAIYAPLHRVAWCLAIGWVLVACITDNAALVNKFLSWKLFIPTSRLTYCAYLANGLIEIYNMGVLRQTVYLSKYELGCKILGHVILTYVVAFFLSILFESPIHGLEKILLRKDRFKEIKQNSTVRPVGES
ncbi:unnamed protein product [Acanthoscelides obtectus]|uniref:Nose resistant-to-fluoxetine protein N-terminal domain-containing protein n=1 Tax=Acanthoscelides obtectus TaxID=200917 RepID=A0A9P0P313_ACAOB|nr:unnamed protein product [Acanthoscelides obtectus]CAK1669993.1 Nose resistant to fluoxetine protein 6 [Acanthoscelides obtectus]